MVRTGNINSKFSKTRGKMLNSSNNDDLRQWSELHEDMLIMIMMLLNLRDYFAFGGVCKSWRLLFAGYRQLYMDLHQPLILVLSTHAKRSCLLYNMFERSMYKTVLPFFSGKKCSGFSCGYLVMEDKSNKTGLWLVNPLTRNECHLPCSQYRTDRVIMASSTMVSLDTIIVLTSKVKSFSREGRTPYYRPSNHSVLQRYHSRGLNWTLVRCDALDYEVFMDLAVFKGNLYALTQKARVGILNLGYYSFMTFEEVASTPPILSSSPRLVASNEKLFIVDFENISNFKIYELNFLRRQWLEVDSLGDQALFLGDLTSIALCDATKWGGHSNCIYNIHYRTNKCYRYALDGKLLGSFPIAERGNGKSFGIAQPLWYFPHEAYSIPSLNADCLPRSIDLNLSPYPDAVSLPEPSWSENRLNGQNRTS